MIDAEVLAPIKEHVELKTVLNVNVQFYETLQGKMVGKSPKASLRIHR